MVSIPTLGTTEVDNALQSLLIINTDTVQAIGVFNNHQKVNTRIKLSKSIQT